MKIYLSEITDQESDLDFNQDADWVSRAVTQLDERHPGDPVRPGLKTRPIHAHFRVRMVDEVVVMDGTADAPVQLICSRCASYFEFNAHSRFSALFCNDPELAGVAHLQGKKPVGQNHGWARHEHDSSEDSNIESGNDLEITYLSEDYIDLGEVLSEQVRMQIPFQPLCREACKGICANCGADQNVGRCACSKLSTSSAFSVLKNLKLGGTSDNPGKKN